MACRVTTLIRTRLFLTIFYDVDSGYFKNQDNKFSVFSS